MKPKFLRIIIPVVIVFFIYGCAGKATFEPVENGVLLKKGDISTKIVFYDNNIVRVVKWHSKGTDEKVSLSVVMERIPQLDLTVSQKDDTVYLTTPMLKVAVSLKSTVISYLKPDNTVVLSESGCEFTPVQYKTDTAFHVKQIFNLSPDEGIYGLGQHQYGYMNYRGKTINMVQSNTDAVNPFLVSTKGYGILWDNYSRTVYADDSSKMSSFWSDVADNIDYYFVAGENIDQAIAGYRKLTGDAPMYGKWAYGYWQSKEHYDTQDEIMAVARKYRQLKYPIDNIIQDWDYWNGFKNWGSMEFDPVLFPNPDAMVKELHQMNYHMMISIWPAIGPNTAFYKDMLANGYLYPPVGWAGFKYYDAYNPGANKMYWDYLNKGLASKGIDAWWIDSTEPDVVNALTKDAEEYEMKKMDNNYLGSFARYLNTFSLVMTESVYNNWRNTFPNRRCYILTRSAFAGQQRNAATTWSGDIGANWEVYKNQIAAGVNHSMSGIPYWTFDIGAFVLGAYEGVFMKGGKDPSYQELYTRMFQLGVFTPIFRSHGSETPREIWEMGDFVPVLLKFDHLRYRLMPYIYSLAWKVTNHQYTIMRGLPMDFASDNKTYNIDDQFMFGPSLMACPVTEYMYHRPPQSSVMVAPEFFKTNDGKPGLLAKYYKDNKYKVLGKETVDKNIDVFWYTGRPEYVTDSMFSIRWEGKLIPNETGKHQFHMKSFDAKRIFLDGKQLPIVYTSTEQYTAMVDLEAGKEYAFVLETENSSTGAARMRLFWKTPSIFADELKIEERAKSRNVYLPEPTAWYDFWTGEKTEGGQIISSLAPIDIMPLFVKAGSIIPMGPFLQYATEKPADPVELRVYPGANGSFVLYEDENDNYNYEKGVFATIEFNWDDAKKLLTIGERKGSFPGMLKTRTFNIILVSKGKGTGVEIALKPDKSIKYSGNKVEVQL